MVNQVPFDNLTLPPVLRNDLQVDEVSIPRSPTIFFDNWSHSTPIPPPSQVLENFKNQVNVLQKVHSSLVHFPALDLVVKFGSIHKIPVSEGQTLWFLSHLKTIRVPKVYGWCENNGRRFIYMEYISGVTVEERWPDLSITERSAVEQQLKSMISSLRNLKPTPDDVYIGSLCHGNIFDEFWTRNRPEPFPCFRTSKDFNDAFFSFARGLPGYPDNWYLRQIREAFPDDSPIVFTHGDLQRKNIIMSPTGTEVLAILDWTQSGWYPCYWEYIKAFCWPENEDEAGKSWEKAEREVIQPEYENELTSVRHFCSMGLLV